VGSKESRIQNADLTNRKCIEAAAPRFLGKVNGTGDGTSTLEKQREKTKDRRA
jgi:hypothetical protein